MSEELKIDIYRVFMPSLVSVINNNFKMELAIFSDCQKLIENFIKNNQPDFDTFCEIWKSMCFQHMFTVQSSMIEIVQTTKAIFHLAKRTVCGRKITGQPVETSQDCATLNQKQQLKRLCGLYLMYATYFKQPTKEYVKIELSLNSWQELCAFVKSAQQQFEETAFIFWKLKVHDAFRFTASDYYLGLDNLVDYDHLDKFDHISDSTHDGLECDLPAMYNLKTVSAKLAKVEEKYNEMKRELARQDNEMTENALSTTNVFQNVHNTLEFLANLSKRHVQRPAASSKVARRDIKRKARAFERDTETSEGDSECDNEPTTSKEKIYRRMSANTVFAQPLSANLLKDLKTHDTDSD